MKLRRVLDASPCPGRVRCWSVRVCVLVTLALRVAPARPLPQLTSPGEGTAPVGADVTIVLPPRLMAGHPATLAVLGSDGKLAPGVKVDLGDDQSVVTDYTGRASFRAPASGDYLLAKSFGASAAALIDPAVAESEPKAVTVPAIVSMHDQFWVCGAGLSADAAGSTVKINGKPALVLAGSPICLIALPGPSAKPGAASLSIDAPGVRWSAKMTLVSLEFETPKPALRLGEKGQLAVRARGSSEKLPISVENASPSVLRFARGDLQTLTTTGGAENMAIVRVQVIASGDFSFRARLLPASDTASGTRYLRAARFLAPQELQSELSRLADRLARHPRDARKVRAQLKGIARNKVSGDCRILLDAALSAL